MNQIPQLPDEIWLYMCDVSSINYMYLYRLNRHFYAMLKAYKSKMRRKYLSSFIARDGDSFKRTETIYGEINGHRNGSYSRITTVNSYYMTGRIADKTTGTYRDGLKHGEWIKISNGKITTRTSFCFGVAIVIHKYTRDGKLERIMHYDYDGRPIKGEYLDSKMIIHYRRGIIENM